MVSSAFSRLSALAARTFYRLEVVGPAVPRHGPVLLFANHPNSLLDPALVAVAAERPVRFLAKSTLFHHRYVGWLVRVAGAIPVYRRSDDGQAALRNVDMFEAVLAELAAGAAVGIFPEGISHSFPALADLRTGAARIALGASRNGPFPLIPVGLVLRDKGVFRSEAVVIRGRPVIWEDLANRDMDDRTAVRRLTDRLSEGLSEVTLNLESWEDQPLIDCAAAIWEAEISGAEQEADPVERAQTAARVLVDLRRRCTSDRQELAREVDRHRRRLRVLGLAPGDLAARVDLGTGLIWVWRRVPLGLPPLVLIGIVGAMIFWLPYRMTDAIVRRMEPTTDQSSTYKVLTGVAVYLLWMGAIGMGLGWLLSPWLGVVVAVILPFVGIAGLWIRERWRGAWREARRFFLLRSRRDAWQQLRSEQSRLAGRLQQAFEEWCQRQS